MNKLIEKFICLQDALEEFEDLAKQMRMVITDIVAVFNGDEMVGESDIKEFILKSMETLNRSLSDIIREEQEEKNKMN